jgi:hypothetical protein
MDAAPGVQRVDQVGVAVPHDRAAVAGQQLARHQLARHQPCSQFFRWKIQQLGRTADSGTPGNDHYTASKIKSTRRQHPAKPTSSAEPW